MSKQRNKQPTRDKVFERDAYTCQICGKKSPEIIPQLSHIKPIYKGGTDNIDNLITLCAQCNADIGAKDLSNYLIEAISQNTKFYKTFSESLDIIDQLANIELSEAKLQSNLYRLLFANTIAAMETYLSDAFINTVTGNRKLVHRLIETTPAFNEKKYKLSDILTWIEDTDKSVKQYLLEIIYHNIFVVKNMYKCVLELNFPDDMEALQKAVRTRHDIVHRNGKTKTGEPVDIDRDKVTENIQMIRGFVEDIDRQLKQKTWD
jgi:hypothetical protein